MLSGPLRKLTGTLDCIARDAQNTDHEKLPDCCCQPSLHLKMRQAQLLEIFLTARPLDSKTEFPVCSNHFRMERLVE